ncbi:hypothetical protein SAMN05192541_14361 [Bradyrhizobium arachidis]|nr:hypothetical protein SAMN05192541_14361 [Bradyrhizobium arachidis]
MRISPSIVPGSDRDIYPVLDDFGEYLGPILARDGCRAH